MLTFRCWSGQSIFDIGCVDGKETSPSYWLMLIDDNVVNALWQWQSVAIISIVSRFPNKSLIDHPSWIFNQSNCKLATINSEQRIAGFVEQLPRISSLFGNVFFLRKKKQASVAFKNGRRWMNDKDCTNLIITFELDTLKSTLFISHSLKEEDDTGPKSVCSWVFEWMMLLM